MKREITCYRYLRPTSDQWNLGVCWAMVIARLLSAVYSKQLSNGSPVELSPQHMVDCFYPIIKDYLNEDDVGSQGDYPLSTSFALILATYIKGIFLESEYEYEAVRGECRQNVEGVRVAPTEEQIYHFEDTEDDLILIKSTLDKGIPIAANIDPCDSFHEYKNGIFTVGPDEEKGKGSGHSVLIVGYGQDGVVPYYWIQNSWGEEWGIEGFGKVQRSLLTHLVTTFNVTARLKTD
ncbi:hypothetical protein LIER_40292 [Lithospermum erythrorhizon]|uniref:Peptidase C1A papain C-terminal domain-containing protein n=1 Tax=Lithospermum erythrorhizon TaxID=34254 RepID=A0AAV3QY14_LITER